MNIKEILHYLSCIGTELEKTDIEENIQLLLVGGVYMLTQIKNSQMITEDIDTIWLYPQVCSGSDVYTQFKRAIRLVAYNDSLGSLWLNTDTSNSITKTGPLPKVKSWKFFGPMHIYLPPKEFIFAHKFLVEGNDEIEEIDILRKQLHINTREKAQK